MIKMLLVFFLLFAGFWFGISGLRSMSGKEKYRLTKLALYSIMCAGLTTLTLIGIVILF